jgi:plasmid stabilization system protein ParE
VSLPPDFIDDLPENLSRLALRDFLGILRKSKSKYGLVVARETRERLIHRFGQIEQGTLIGHNREDVRPKKATLFFNEHPWVIVFNPDTGAVKRVLHGSREFPALFG